MAVRTLWNESQFQAPATNVTAKSSGKTARAGVTIYDACGVNALAMAESALASYSSTMHVFAKMAPAGLCDETGRTVIENIQRQAVSDGFISTKEHIIAFNGNGIPEAIWRHFLAVHLAAGAAVILETLNGQVLSDLITHEGEDATNLQRHFFSLYAAETSGETPYFPNVKALPNGYV